MKRILVMIAVITLLVATFGNTHDAPPDPCAHYAALHFENIADCRIAQIEGQL